MRAVFGEVETVDGERLMTVGEVAERLRLKPDTVRDLARCGELPGFKAPRQWRFREGQIEAWIAERAGAAA